MINEYAQVVDGGLYFVTATREGTVVTWRAWVRVDDHNWYAEVRELAGRKYGQLGTLETDKDLDLLAQFDQAYKLIKRVYAGIKFDLIGRFGWGTIEVRYATEVAAKQVTGEI